MRAAASSITRATTRPRSSNSSRDALVSSPCRVCARRWAISARHSTFRSEARGAQASARAVVAGPRLATAASAMKPSALSRIPASVWTLGLVSMLMDVSSELIHSLLPLFMITVLGASTFAVGIIEGIAEATAMITKVFSGYVSDRFRQRKLLVVLGYGLAALNNPMFPLATSLG